MDPSKTPSTQKPSSNAAAAAVENNNNAVKILGILNDKLKKLRENNSVEELKKKTKNLNIRTHIINDSINKKLTEISYLEQHITTCGMTNNVLLYVDRGFHSDDEHGNSYDVLDYFS